VEAARRFQTRGGIRGPTYLIRLLETAGCFHSASAKSLHIAGEIGVLLLLFMLGLEYPAIAAAQPA